MVTLKDIAREAGVSITTVSNAVHNRSSRISPELMYRIQEIIKRENYIPSMAARTLAKNTSPIIGVINHLMSRRSGGFMADPFHNIFIGAIEDYVSDKGYFVMVRTVEDSQELKTAYRHWNLAGMIITGLFEGEFFDTVRELGIPYTLVDSYIDMPDIHSVGLEDMEGGYIATQHLLECGHRTIAFASPYIRENSVVEQRLLGYKKALAQYDIPFERQHVFEQDFSIGVGVRFEQGIKLGHLLSKRSEITAIFATADILAAGIMSGLLEMGVRIPQDKSIIGFDDNYLCRITYPRLTSVFQDVREKGSLATQLLLSQLSGKQIRKKRIILPVSLAVRDSVRDVN